MTIAPTQRKTELFVVGEHHAVSDENEYAWGLVGVFDDRAEAERIAEERGGFVGPIVVGEIFPPSPVPWPGAYYPAFRA
ncbi:MAG: hypothetical protein WC107_06325 [Patescibacteria group bacterium]